MGVRTTELRCKEVICVSDGKRLGFVEDVEVELPSGEVLAIVVPGPCKYLGLVGKTGEYIIPWHCICRIGPDIILVDIKPDECRKPIKRIGLPL